jgi:hypothetical protein
MAEETESSSATRGAFLLRAIRGAFLFSALSIITDAALDGAVDVGECALGDITPDPACQAVKDAYRAK